MQWPYMDPQDVAALFATLKDLFTITFGAIALRFSWLALSTWRRQLSGQNEFEVARKLLRAAFALRDEYKVTRAPGIEDWELRPSAEDDEREKGLPNELRSVIALQRAYNRRLDSLGKIREDFKAAMLDAEVLWGHGVREWLDPLDMHYLSMCIAVDLYVDRQDLPRGRSGTLVSPLGVEAKRSLRDRLKGKAD